MLKKINYRELGMDLLADVVGGMLVAVGVYNFALNANFPVAGFSGIAIVLYHLFGIPVGTATILLNIPVTFLCFKFLGKRFLFRSLKSMLISSLLIDYVAPLLPVYDGERILAAICMGVLCGAGYAIIYMRDSSTGGQDFITMSIHKLLPHVTIGSASLVLDIVTILIGSLLVFREMDGLLYGVIVSYIMAALMDRIMYGMYEGKMTLVITEHGEEVVNQIDEHVGRGATMLKGIGGYSKRHKDVVLCACNNKEMYRIKRQVKEIDPKAFTIIMESNEVVGEGFREE